MIISRHLIGLLSAFILGFGSLSACAVPESISDAAAEAADGGTKDKASTKDGGSKREKPKRTRTPSRR